MTMLPKFQMRNGRSSPEVPFDEDAYRTRVGVPALFGEPEYSLIERMWARPTLTPTEFGADFRVKV